MTCVFCFLTVSNLNNRTVTLWHHDKKTNELRGSVRFTTKSKVITAMAKAHNNRILACYSGTNGNRPGTSRQANIELLGPQLNVEKTFQGSRREITSIAFNEHQLIGTGGVDMVVRIYNMSGSGEPVKVRAQTVLSKFLVLFPSSIYSGKIPTPNEINLGCIEGVLVCWP